MRMTASRWNERANKTEEALARREISNGGRWCEVVLKATGETVRVVRTGFGPMERPYGDGHEVHINGEKIAAFNSLYGVALWMCKRS